MGKVPFGGEGPCPTREMYKLIKIKFAETRTKNYKDGGICSPTYATYARCTDGDGEATHHAGEGAVAWRTARRGRSTRMQVSALRPPETPEIPGRTTFG